MGLFRRRPKITKFIHKFNEAELIEFIKHLLSNSTSAYNINKLNSSATLIFDADNFKVQEAIEDWLNTEQRKNLRMIYLYCTCPPKEADVNCPIHGSWETTR